MLHDYAVDKIHELGYVSLPLSFSGLDVDELFYNFDDLLDEVYGRPSQHGSDVIRAFTVQSSDRPLDSAGFLEQRRAGQVNPYEIDRLPGSDNKDVLHFTPLSTVRAPEYMASRGGMSVAMAKLVANCTELHSIVKNDLKPVLDALQLSDTLVSYNRLDNVHLLRLVRYLGNAEGAPFIASDHLASLHFDRSKLTAALIEDRPGLVGAPGNNLFGQPELSLEELDGIADRALSTPVQHHEGRLKLFAGAGYNHLPSAQRHASGDLQPLLHGVVDDQPGQERKAAVFFINECLGAGLTTAAPNECDFDAVRQHIYDRNTRYGAVQEDAS